MAPQTIDDVRSYVKAAGIPFIVKGVLSEQDAAKCLDAGVQNKIESMTNELAAAMARTCSADLNSIDDNVIWR